MMIERNIKTVIVTGPTGAVGTALCSRLLQAGCTVVAVCRPGSPRAVALPKDANLYVVACDAANLADLPQCMAAAGLPVQADAFFHLAWAHTIGAGRNDMPAQIENIRYTIDAVRTAAAMGCPCVCWYRQPGRVWPCGRCSAGRYPHKPRKRVRHGQAVCRQMSRTRGAALGMDMCGRVSFRFTAAMTAPNTMISADAADALYRMACHGRSRCRVPRWAAAPPAPCGNILRPCVMPSTWPCRLAWAKSLTGRSRSCFCRRISPSLRRIPALRRAPPLPMASAPPLRGQKRKSKPIKPIRNNPVRAGRTRLDEQEPDSIYAVDLPKVKSRLPYPISPRRWRCFLRGISARRLPLRAWPCWPLPGGMPCAKRRRLSKWGKKSRALRFRCQSWCCCLP